MLFYQNLVLRVIEVILAPFTKNFNSAIASSLPGNVTSCSNVALLTSNFLTKNAHVSEKLGLTTTTREPSFISLILYPFVSDNCPGLLYL